MGHPDEKVIGGSSRAAESAELAAVPAPVSPLGWSIWGRLLCAGAATALLWLAVAWAVGWL
jgi:hypothetical protein